MSPYDPIELDPALVAQLIRDELADYQDAGDPPFSIVMRGQGVEGVDFGEQPPYGWKVARIILELAIDA